MRIALINENSQVQKKEIFEHALKKVVEPLGFVVDNTECIRQKMKHS